MPWDCWRARSSRGGPLGRLRTAFIGRHRGESRALVPLFLWEVTALNRPKTGAHVLFLIEGGFFYRSRKKKLDIEKPLIHRKERKAALPPPFVAHPWMVASNISGVFGPRPPKPRPITVRFAPWLFI